MKSVRAYCRVPVAGGVRRESDQTQGGVAVTSGVGLKGLLA